MPSEDIMTAKVYMVGVATSDEEASILAVLDGRSQTDVDAGQVSQAEIDSMCDSYLESIGPGLCAAAG